jgi:phosphoribosylformylglycinamidine cyclo-ligase
VQAGDLVIGFASPGLRCNGYSLARRALLDRAGRRLEDPAWAGAHHTLADELVRPSVIYAPTMRKLREKVDVHAFAHITGGGLPDNIARILPSHCGVVLWRGRWDEPRIFSEIQAAGDVADDEMAHVFNLGLGMVAVVPARDAHDALDAVRAAGQEAWIVGEVSEGRGRVSITRN